MIEYWFSCKPFISIIFEQKKMEHMQMTSASKAEILSGNKVKTMYLDPSIFFKVQSTFETIEIIRVETKK
jgi:hypothetical protein